jgi:hypothetical protein
MPVARIIARKIDRPEITTEVRIRRAAHTLGLHCSKTESRAVENLGGYRIVNGFTGVTVAGARWSLSEAEALAWLEERG